MPRLGAKARAELPDSAFAYVDSDRRRHLPIHDESHVRNALARFSQISFEDDETRDRARTRLLRAAKKYGIVPIGFVSTQLRPQLKLPRGSVTFLLTDIEGSTELLSRLEDRYGALLMELRRLLRATVRRFGGREVDARADEMFAVFERASSAIEAAIAIQRAVRSHSWTDGAEVLLRIGVHRGRPTLTDSGYIGLAVHTAARVCSAAHGGQIVLSSAAREAIEGSLVDGVALRTLGSWRLHGLPEPMELFQVDVGGLATTFPPPRSGPSHAARGVVSA